MIPPSRFQLVESIFLAAVLGGLIGLEREFRGKPAGFRTNMLICVGSALLTEMSIRIAALAPGVGDPARVASYVVGGIGFLGAGVIWRGRGEVNGVTTAATIWMVAAIGITVAGGERVAAITATAFVLVTLAILGRVEDLFENRHRAHVIHLTLVDLPAAARGTAVRRGLDLLSERGLSPEFIRSTVKAPGLTEVTCRVRARARDLRPSLVELADQDTVAGIGLEVD